MRTWRTRFGGLLCCAAALTLLSGCVLTDQQLASIWQSVVTTALTTLVGGLLSVFFPSPTQ